LRRTNIYASLETVHSLIEDPYRRRAPRM